MQLTVFADGVQRIKPLLIFKGTGKRIPEKEAKQYDPRVVVKIQENAWCDDLLGKAFVELTEYLLRCK